MAPHAGLTRTKHRIGGYRVIAPIGAGGFATVYRALNETTKEEVAIKVLAENHSLVPDTRRRFVDEVGLLRTIDSPSIAKIYELGETDTGQPYMVLELADRGDLRRRLEEIRSSHQALNRSDLTMLAHHLFVSLTTLHEAEIVHRDVSPGNILIRSRRQGGRRARRVDGSVTLLEPGERFLLADLGHAKDLIQASGFTAGGGTRGYASPEQRDDVTVVDLRADIFSATAVLEWAAHDGIYAEDLEPFFDVGLASEPEDRFESMEEWHTAFSAALGATNENSRGRFPSLARLKVVTKSLSERVTERSMALGAMALVAVGFVTLGLSAALDGGTTIAGSPGEISAAAFDELEVSTTDVEEPGLLRVKGNEEEVPDEAAGPSASVDVDTTNPSPTVPTDSSTPESSDQQTTSSGASGTTIETTTPSSGSSSSSETSQTTDVEFPNSPLAYVSSPREGSEVSGDLEVAGTATFPGEVAYVRVVVRNTATGMYWNPETGEFQDEWDPFIVEVGGDDRTNVTWGFTVPDAQLTPGDYLIRAWARGVRNEGDPRGDAKIVTVR